RDAPLRAGGGGEGEVGGGGADLRRRGERGGEGQGDQGGSQSSLHTESSINLTNEPSWTFLMASIGSPRAGSPFTRTRRAPAATRPRSAVGTPCRRAAPRPRRRRPAP